MEPSENKINEILDNAKDRFQNVVVIGVNASNNIDILTSVPNYPALQYFLNRASFELLIHEKDSINKANSEAQVTETVGE